MASEQVPEILILKGGDVVNDDLYEPNTDVLIQNGKIWFAAPFLF